MSPTPKSVCCAVEVARAISSPEVGVPLARGEAVGLADGHSGRWDVPKAALGVEQDGLPADHPLGLGDLGERTNVVELLFGEQCLVGRDSSATAPWSSEGTAMASTLVAAP